MTHDYARYLAQQYFGEIEDEKYLSFMEFALQEGIPIGLDSEAQEDEFLDASYEVFVQDQIIDLGG